MMPLDKSTLRNRGEGRQPTASVPPPRRWKGVLPAAELRRPLPVVERRARRQTRSRAHAAHSDKVRLTRAHAPGPSGHKATRWPNRRV
eukprot:scaffold185172_cov30-Tisochrysis_lutea.AAC.1